MLEAIRPEIRTPQETDPMSEFADTIYRQKYAHPGENWPDTAKRVASEVMKALGYDSESLETKRIEKYIRERKFLPGGRYLYASGRGLHQTQNCLLMRVEDSRESWAELMHNAAMALMTGAGIGVVYSDLRERGAVISKTGGYASGPCSLMNIINEIGRHVMQGGSRRSAIWAGLHWWHPDVFEFIDIKDWSQELRDLKATDFNTPAPMELTNVSVILDDDFFEAYGDGNHPQHEHAMTVYQKVVKQMVTKAEPGFSVDTGDNKYENLRNACTEVTSEDDSDVCNLGSINLARIEDQDEMRDVVMAGTLFLLAGTVYSHLPYDKVNQTREKNRRLGLGIMGVHEWLLQRGKRYGADDLLAEWLAIYRDGSRHAATFYANQHGLSVPVKVRAIAPTGTIGIIAETTTGIEPIFCVAYKRRYLTKGLENQWVYQYVIDPTAKRLIDKHGVDPNDIEDAYTLSYDVERRVAFQAWIQQYVDHGISSTINLPYALEDHQERQWFGDMLMEYLPKLRGITCYPDGSRGGQPLSVASYSSAIGQDGVVFEEEEGKCIGGICGS